MSKATTSTFRSTAHFRVDRSVANEGASSYLKDLLALQLAVLQEAEFEVKVQLNRSDVPSLRFLGIAVNGCQVLCYRDIEVDFDPYCRPDAVRRPSNGDDEWELAPLRGEWIVNRSHPVTAELDIGTRTTGARARLLFPNLGDDVWGLRGSICYAISEAGSGSRVIEPKHTMELLYPEHFVKEDESLALPLSYLSRFVLKPSDADATHFVQFQREEFAFEQSGRLFNDLRAANKRLDAFVSAILSLLANAIQINRVRGSRQSIDSEHPLHLEQNIMFQLDDAAKFDDAIEFDAKPPAYALANSPLHRGSRRWPGADMTIDPDIAEVLGRYAIATRNAASTDVFGAATERDFPNFCLSRYLHALCEYRIIPEIYTLQGAGDGYDSQDKSGLAGTRLVYFALLDESKERRTFDEVGSSLGYLFPILAVLGEDRLCGIEQPELHLHPRAQDQLADVFLHAANAGRRAIIESHSEVFLLRLAKRIKDTHEWSARMAANVQVMSESLRADADGMRIYYFFPDPDRGTVVLPIRFAPDGSLIDNWPNGLFENDWTSGLDRLKLFCGAADAEQAGKQWPWIAQIEDPSVRRWLAGCWLTTKMGPGQDEMFVLFAAKIVEKVLAERLLRPLDTASENACRESSTEAWDRDFAKCWGRRRTPVLDSWMGLLARMKRRETKEHIFIDRLRLFLQEQPWGPQWLATQDELHAALGLLQQQRNKVAHTEDVQDQFVERIRQIIVDGGRPGLVFRSLGIVDRVGGGGFREV